MEHYEILGENDFDSLISGNQFPVMYKGIALAAGQGVLKRGSLLGVITASGYAVLCKAAATDGSNTPKYILAQDTDTGTSDAAEAIAYQSGVFNRSALVLASGESVSSFEDTLRMYNIILTDSMENPAVPVAALSVSPAAVTLSLAGTTTSQLTAALTPSDASDEDVSYSSSNSAVATVSASGLITAVAAGTATITVTSRDGGYTAVCAVTVTA